MTEVVLGVDLGGTTVKAGIVDAGGRVIAAATRPSGERRGLDAWVATAVEAASEAVSLAGREPVMAGFAVPGAVDPTAVRLVDLVSRLPTCGIDLRDAFAAVGVPVAAENDAKAALEAELLWGGHSADADIVVLTVGTGVGSAARIDGRAPGGDVLLAGNQLGHVTLEFDGDPCVCGNRGCAETLASATALVAGARRAGLDVDDAAAVFDAHHAMRHPAATEAIAAFGQALAATIVTAIHAYQPQVVVLTGGVMAGAEHFINDVRSSVAERAWTVPRGRVDVKVSSFGPAAGVLAGAAVAWRQVNGRRPSKCTDK